MFLAGDVGGTKTLLGLFAPASRSGRRRSRSASSSRSTTTGSRRSSASSCRAQNVSPRQIEAACFGVAGAVTDHVARLTNVPWLVDAGARRRARPASQRCLLLNDLEALGYAIPVLEPDELAVLQQGVASADGNAAVIAAGTGLGEALLHNVDGRFVPAASEGGHADFAPHTTRELRMADALMKIFDHVSVEHVLSGPGLVNIYQFTHDAFGSGPSFTPSSVAAEKAVRRRRTGARPGRPAGPDQPGGARAALPAVRRSAGHVRRASTARKRATWRCATSRPAASTSAAASRRRSCRRSSPGRSSTPSARRAACAISSRRCPSR